MEAAVVHLKLMNSNLKTINHCMVIIYLMELFGLLLDHVMMTGICGLKITFKIFFFKLSGLLFLMILSILIGSFSLATLQVVMESINLHLGLLIISLVQR